MADPIEVRVRGLIMENQSKSPIVILQEMDGERVLPIWIGESEARAIGMTLAGESLERPLTHDLCMLLLKSLEARLTAVTITALQDNTFYAEIHLDQGGRQILVDARPSDSLALAMRAGARIYVAPEVLDASGHDAAVVPEPEEKSEAAKREELRRFLEELDPKDFGKFGL